MGARKEGRAKEGIARPGRVERLGGRGRESEKGERERTRREKTEKKESRLRKKERGRV